MKSAKTLTILVLVFLILPAALVHAGMPEQAKLLASDGAADDSFGYSVSISSDYAIVGAYYDDDNGNDSGSAYIFKRDGASWSEQAKLVASDGAAGDQFGSSVSISGDYAIVGAEYDDDNGSNSGSAYIFKRDGGSWSEQAKLVASDGAASDYFGVSVSLSGDYAIVGAHGDDGFTGSAYIFKRSGASWSEQAKLVASDGASGDYFGVSVSLSGDYAIVGAFFDDDNGFESGSAYIFKRDGGSWSEQAKLLASDGADFDEFGRRVSISGDYAIVGACDDDDNGSSSGSAYIFKRDGTSWSEQAKLTASDGAADDRFGSSVSISSDYAIVGAYGDDDNGSSSGSAYIFKRSGTNWSEQAKLTASDGEAGDLFGSRSVSISGDYAIVGAVYDDDNGDGSGSAYVYNGGYICGTKWHDSDGGSDHDDDEQVITGWRIYIDVNENGQFDAGEPNDVTVDNGSYVLNVPAGSYVVAEQDKSCWEQTYPGGDEIYSVTLVENWQVVEGRSFGNALSGEIHPSRWQQQQQDELVASDGAADDRFGGSVSISGDYVIVGAYRDDDNGSQSGSAYVFAMNDVNCGEWDQRAKLTASDGAVGDTFGLSVSISGGYAIVGAYGDDDNGSESGSAYIFRGDGTSWSEQVKLVASDSAASDFFGWSVSISGDYAIVGAYYDDDNGEDSGSAYIFKRSGTSWSEQAKLLASDGAADDRFGESVSISGDYAIVGAYRDDDNGGDSGSAYIFKRSGTSWSEQAKLVASDSNTSDYFGSSVSISGGYAIIGAWGDDDNGSYSGSAYIFRRDGGTWSEQAKLLASDGAADDRFGDSVSISGDTAVVGARYDDDNGEDSGSACIFERSGTSWSEQAKLVASDGAADDRFGVSVSIGGGYAIVGAHRSDGDGSGSGSAYMFGKILCPSVDLTGDCFVNFKDFAEMTGQWLQGGQEP